MDGLDGFVLAGGASRRMGSDKALLRFPGTAPMALHVATTLASVCTRVRLVRQNKDDASFRDGIGTEFAVVSDGGGPRHPLRGIAAALFAAATPMVVIVPCDVPFLSVGSLRKLMAASAERGAVAFDGVSVHPLIGVFPRTLALAARRAADAGTSVLSLVADLARVTIPGRELANINAPSNTKRQI